MSKVSVGILPKGRRLMWLTMMAGCLAVLVCACSGEDKMKSFADEFAAAVAKGDTAAIKRMYPDVVKADSLMTGLSTDSLTVAKDEAQNLTTLTWRPGIDLVVSESPDGQLVVKSSHGLFAYPAEVVAFAKKTGQWKDGLTDAEQAERMADHGLADYLLEDYNVKLKAGLTIASAYTYGDNYYEGEWVSSKGMEFKVVNKTAFDVPGSVWSITYKEGYWGGGKMATEEIPGKDVKAGGTVTLRTSKLGSSTESETGQILNIKGLTMEDLLKVFQPTGKEYEEYVMKGGSHEPVTMAESLEFVVEGLMGGLPTRLSLVGKGGGNLMYATGGKDAGYSYDEQRSVDFVSYTPASGQLVLRVKRFDGTVTGNLVGTYRNGRYQGQFKNVNGKSSSFDFK